VIPWLLLIAPAIESGIERRHWLDTAPQTTDTLKTMFSRFTTFILLGAITLQCVFGGLRGSVIICLGGGHDHGGLVEVDEQPLQGDVCCTGCTHSEWPASSSQTDHLDMCDCTDIELGLVTLLVPPRTLSGEIDTSSPAAMPISSLVRPLVHDAWRGPPLILRGDPSAARRLACLRSTRLIV
jgi:hypothetical protein